MPKVIMVAFGTLCLFWVKVLQRLLFAMIVVFGFVMKSQPSLRKLREDIALEVILKKGVVNMPLIEIVN
ncbi:hypothetical protein CL620_06125 [archaeon]|nr:hypothetical protein [archaeon]